MNYRAILKIYTAERQLTDDETAFLNTLRGMTDAERELFTETLQPEKVVKAPTKERKIEHCGVCDYTRRAPHHKDSNHRDYHEFHTRTERPEKSVRTSSLKERIQGTAASKTSNNGIYLCAASLTSSGANCNLPEGHALHVDKSYADHHPFRSTAPPVNNQSVANGGGERSGVNSGIEGEDAGSAAPAASE